MKAREAERSDFGTPFMMVLTLILVILAVRANLSLLNSLYMILAGIGLQIATNVIGLGLWGPAMARWKYAMFLMWSVQPVVLFAISLYMAGVFTLLIQLCRWGFSSLVGG
jgi:hypothetical protein